MRNTLDWRRLCFKVRWFLTHTHTHTNQGDWCKWTSGTNPPCLSKIKIGFVSGIILFILYTLRRIFSDFRRIVHDSTSDGQKRKHRTVWRRDSGLIFSLHVCNVPSAVIIHEDTFDFRLTSNIMTNRSLLLQLPVLEIHTAITWTFCHLLIPLRRFFEWGCFPISLGLQYVHSAPTCTGHHTRQ